MGQELHVVTGAFGFTGKYIAAKLIEAGHRVRTLTNSPRRKNPFKGKVEAHPYNFDEPEKLVDSLRGASVLYNNYWVRFNYRGFTFSEAVANSLGLFDAAKKAGVKRVVHISITNPSEDSPFEYFRGKARLERALVESGLSYAILRPAVIFGKEDILINNIAWLLRTFPVFGIFGDGLYRLQPIYVGDLAELAVREGRKKENTIIDAIGPETFTYRGLVEEICRAIGKRPLLLHVPAPIGYLAGSIMGIWMRDVLITRDEIQGLMGNLLYTRSRPAGQTRLSEWMKENAKALGARYSREIARRKNRLSPYEKL
jgi:NADH dehydrogenase